jgi:hypothetical protein
VPTTTNLIVNGDAEASPGGEGTPSPTVPGWTTLEGAAAVIRYGVTGYPSRRSPGPSDRAANFFSGGNSPRTRLQQTITLPQTAAIDAGSATFTLAGWLGGYSTQDDGVRLSVEFLGASGPPLGLAVLGPVSAGERNRKTGLWERKTTGVVPPGSRQARVLLLFTRDGGTSNDGYADSLTLTFTTATSSGGRPPGPPAGFAGLNGGTR